MVKYCCNCGEPLANSIHNEIGIYTKLFICFECRDKINYWDETDEEMVFKDSNNNKFITIPFNSNKLHVYFNF